MKTPGSLVTNLLPVNPFNRPWIEQDPLSVTMIRQEAGSVFQVIATDVVATDDMFGKLLFTFLLKINNEPFAKRMLWLGATKPFAQNELFEEIS